MFMILKIQNAGRRLFTLILAGAIGLGWVTALAQQHPAPQTEQSQQQTREDFTDEELQKFISANAKLVQLQQESEAKMVGAIEKEGMTIERFNQILQAQQGTTQESDASPEELASFNNAAQVIIDERQKTEKEMVAMVEQEGIDVNTYQEIMTAYHQNPSVQQRVDQLLEVNTSKRDDQ
jgi:hypothetical protein